MVRMTDFVALRNGGRSSPPDSFRASRSRPSFLSDLGSENKETKKRQEAVRERFFKNDPTISDDRLNRRYSQFAEYEKFKSDPTKTKKVEGTTNLFQAATPGGMTLADKANELALKFGPKPSEVASDIGKGVGNFMSAVAERGTPMMQFLKAMGSGVQSFFSPNTMQVPNAVGTPFQTMNFDQMGQDFMTLSPSGQYLYKGLIKKFNHNEALEIARRQQKQLEGMGYTNPTFTDEGSMSFFSGDQFGDVNMDMRGISTLQ
jgi:hypothetical protein